MNANFFDKRVRPQGNKAAGVFIDLGSNFGQSVEAFKRWKGISSCNYDVFCFEANIEFIPQLISRILPLQSEFSDLQILPVAAHTNNTFVEFDGWQLSEFGKDVSYRRRLVPAIDFVDWFARISHRYDDIILKMDIEGAEYQIIHSLAKTRELQKVTQLFIEIHGERSGFTSSDTQLLINTIYRCGIAPYMWECDVNDGLLYDPEKIFAQIVPSNYSGCNKLKTFYDHHYILIPALLPSI